MHILHAFSTFSSKKGMEMECQQDRLPSALCKVMASLHDSQSLCISDDLQGRHLQNEHLYHRVLDVRKATDAGWGWVLWIRPCAAGGHKFHCFNCGVSDQGSLAKGKKESSLTVRASLFAVQELETAQEVFRSCRSAAQGFCVRYGWFCYA